MLKVICIVVLLCAIVAGMSSRLFSNIEPTTSAVSISDILESAQTTKEIYETTDLTGDDVIQTEGYVLKINNANICNIKFNGKSFEVPLLLISRTLGANIVWESKNKITVKYLDSSVEFDTTDSTLGILVPPGAEGVVRRVEKNELFFDDVSVRGYIRHFLKAEINIDFEEKVFEIINTRNASIS